MWHFNMNHEGNRWNFNNFNILIVNWKSKTQKAVQSICQLLVLKFTFFIKPSSKSNDIFFSEVKQLLWVVNKGQILSMCGDDELFLLDVSKREVEIIQMIKFSKEKLSCMNSAINSCWLFVGTDRGNTHVLKIENFSLSSYIINWNKAIGVALSCHPGSVIHILGKYQSLNNTILQQVSFFRKPSRPIKNLDWFCKWHNFSLGSDSTKTGRNLSVPEKVYKLKLALWRQTVCVQLCRWVFSNMEHKTYRKKTCFNHFSSSWKGIRVYTVKDW